MPRTDDSGDPTTLPAVLPPPAAPAPPAPPPAAPPAPPPAPAPAAAPAAGAGSLAGLGGQLTGVQVGGQTTTLVDVAEGAPPAPPPPGPQGPAGPAPPVGATAYGSTAAAGPFAGHGLVVGSTSASWDAAIANAKSAGGGLDWVAFPPGVPAEVIERARAAGLRVIAWQPPETVGTIDPAQLVAGYGADGYLGQAEGPGQWQAAVAAVGQAGVPAGIITNNWSPGGYGGFPPGVVALPELYVNDGAQADFGALGNFTAAGAAAVVPLAGIYSDANDAPAVYAGLGGLGLPGVSGYSGEDAPTTRGLAAVTGAAAGAGAGSGSGGTGGTGAKAFCFEWGGSKWGRDYPGASAFRTWLKAHNVDVDTWAFTHPAAASCIGIPVPGTPGVGPDRNAPAPPPAPGPQGPSGPARPPAPPPTATPKPTPSPAGILRGADFVDAVRAECDLYDIDPLASFANAINEGLGGGIGDSGLAYGPWQDHLTEFAERPFYGQGRDNPAVQAWAWSAAGIAYVHRAMAGGNPSASHLRGAAAVEAIVRGFERPGDIPGAIKTRTATYGFLVRKGAGVWDYLAQAARGPSLPGQVPGTPGGPPPTGGPPPSSAPAGVQTAWAGVIDFYRLTVPRSRAAVKSIADGLVNVFR